MAQVLFTARSADNEQITGYLEVESGREAVQRLKSLGYTQIELLDDPALAIPRPYLESLSDAQVEAMARFEKDIRAGAGRGRLLVEVARSNAPFVIGGLALCAFGWYWSLAWTALLGAVMALAPFLVSEVLGQRSRDYDRLLRASALGDYPEVLHRAGRLRGKLREPLMEFDIAIRVASVRGIGATLQQKLAELEVWRARLAPDHPGVFESRVSVVHHVWGDLPGYLRLARAAFAKSDGGSAARVDAALAEARAGDAGRAAELIASVDAEEIVVPGRPFVDWVQGIVARRAGSGDAQAYLQSALEGMRPMFSSPALWTSAALCAGDLACVLLEAGDVARARDVARPVWPVLRVHGDADQLRTLRGGLGLGD